MHAMVKPVAPLVHLQVAGRPLAAALMTLQGANGSGLQASVKSTVVLRSEIGNG
jgi:hypothetical protein